MIVAALATFVVGINNEDPNSCWIEGCRYFISSASVPVVVVMLLPVNNFNKNLNFLN